MIIDRSMRGNRLLVAALLAGPILFLVAAEVVRALHTPLYIWLFTEDGPAESTQALLFLGSAIVSASMSRMFWRQGDRVFGWLHAALAAGLFFVAMEEVSWGQRMFSIESPRYFLERNHQQEINFHNLMSVQNRDGSGWFYSVLTAVELYAISAWLVVPARLEKLLGERIHFLVPGWQFAPLFFAATWWRGCEECKEVITPVVWQVQEPPELLIAGGAFLFLLFGSRRLRQMMVRARVEPAADRQTA